MERRYPLEPVAGDLVIIEKARSQAYRLSMVPGAPRIRSATYDRAWAMAQSLAEHCGVDFWLAWHLRNAAANASPVLTLLGRYRA